MHKGTIILIVLALVGCKKGETHFQHFQLEGTVVSVDASAGQVAVKHDAIPGLMGAMTMSYAVKDDSPLTTIKAGDQIKADLVVDRDHYRMWLEHVQVVKDVSQAVIASQVLSAHHLREIKVGVNHRFKKL